MGEILDAPPAQTENTTPAEKLGWTENRPKKKDSAYYEEQRGKYEKYLQGDEFLTIPEGLGAVNAKVISLVTSDIKNRRLIRVSRDSTEESLKSIKITPRILARSSAMWNLRLGPEEEAKHVARCILPTSVI